MALQGARRQSVRSHRREQCNGQALAGSAEVLEREDQTGAVAMGHGRRIVKNEDQV